MPAPKDGPNVFHKLKNTYKNESQWLHEISDGNTLFYLTFIKKLTLYASMYSEMDEVKFAEGSL